MSSPSEQKPTSSRTGGADVEPDESQDTVVTHNGERAVEPGPDGGEEAVERHRSHADDLKDSSKRNPTSGDAA